MNKKVEIERERERERANIEFQISKKERVLNNACA
jgi:hypothetical protein